MKNEEEIKQIITDWFIALEKRQSVEQTEEIKKKGLWKADLKSATFEEISNGIAKTLSERIGG